MRELDNAKGNAMLLVLFLNVSYKVILSKAAFWAYKG